MSSSEAEWSDPRKLAELDGLRVRARYLVEGLITGLHRNPRTGRSIEFASHRDYVPGDDLRRMDWRAFARTDRLQVKHFQDETNLTTWLILDDSRSMTYASDPSALTKRQYVQLLAAGLAWIVLQQQDAVGLAIIDTELRAFLPATSQPGRFDQIVEVLQQAPAGGRTNLAAGLSVLADRLPRRGLIFLISDFLDELHHLIPALRQLACHQHEIAALHIVDVAEATFTFPQSTRFVDLEQPAELTVDGSRLRDAYLAEFRAHCQALQAACRQRQIRYVQCQTSVPLSIAIRRVLSDASVTA